MASGLRDKKLIEDAKAGSFDAAITYIRSHRMRSLGELIGVFHPFKDVESWQFDMYADAWRTARELRELEPT